MVRVSIQPQVRPLFGFSRLELRRAAESAACAFGWSLKDIELLVTTDREVAEKNKVFLGLPGPTNVLSFPLDMDTKAGLNGSIVISAHALKREAELYAQDWKPYCLRMLVHGFLHLAGYEHSQQMEAMTEAGVDKILQKLDS